MDLKPTEWKKMIGKLTGLMFSAAAMAPWAAWAGGADEGYRHGSYMWGGGGHMFFGPVIMILVIAAIVALVVWIMRGTGRPRHRCRHRRKSPQDILKERYARGELSTKEFEERRKVLGD